MRRDVDWSLATKQSRDDDDDVVKKFAENVMCSDRVNSYHDSIPIIQRAAATLLPAYTQVL